MNGGNFTSVCLLKLFAQILCIITRLDGKHVIFGEVIAGLDILKKIEAVGSQSGKTTTTVVITKSGLS